MAAAGIARTADRGAKVHHGLDEIAGAVGGQHVEGQALDLGS
jgi:hypothetical protein